MLKGGLNYGLRCILMGLRNPRPEYGDEGSLNTDEMRGLKLFILSAIA